MDASATDSFLPKSSTADDLNYTDAYTSSSFLGATTISSSFTVSDATDVDGPISSESFQEPSPTANELMNSTIISSRSMSDTTFSSFITAKDAITMTSSGANQVTQSEIATVSKTNNSSSLSSDPIYFTITSTSVIARSMMTNIVSTSRTAFDSSTKIVTPEFSHSLFPTFFPKSSPTQSVSPTRTATSPTSIPNMANSSCPEFIITKPSVINAHRSFALKVELSHQCQSYTGEWDWRIETSDGSQSDQNNFNGIRQGEISMPDGFECLYFNQLNGICERFRLCIYMDTITNECKFYYYGDIYGGNNFPGNGSYGRDNYPYNGGNNTYFGGNYTNNGGYNPFNGGNYTYHGNYTNNGGYNPFNGGNYTYHGNYTNYDGYNPFYGGNYTYNGNQTYPQNFECISYDATGKCLDFRFCIRLDFNSGNCQEYTYGSSKYDGYNKNGTYYDEYRNGTHYYNNGTYYDEYRNGTHYYNNGTYYDEYGNSTHYSNHTTSYNGGFNGGYTNGTNDLPPNSDCVRFNSAGGCEEVRTCISFDTSGACYQFTYSNVPPYGTCIKFSTSGACEQFSYCEEYDSAGACIHYVNSQSTTPVQCSQFNADNSCAGTCDSRNQYGECTSWYYQKLEKLKSALNSSSQFFVPDVVYRMKTSKKLIVVRPKTLNANTMYTVVLSANGISKPERRLQFDTRTFSFSVISGISRRVSSSISNSLAPLFNGGYTLPPFLFENTECNWTCTNLTSNNECVLSDLINTSICTSLILPANSLVSGQYKFVLGARHEVQTGKEGNSTYEQNYAEPAFLDVVNEPVLSVEIFKFSDSFGSTSFYLDTKTAQPTNLTIWKSESECFQQNFTLVYMNEESLRTVANSTQLKFKSGVLAPNNSYCFTAEVKNATHSGLAYSIVNTTTDIQEFECDHIRSPTTIYMDMVASSDFIITCTRNGTYYDSIFEFLAAPINSTGQLGAYYHVAPPSFNAYAAFILLNGNYSVMVVSKDQSNVRKTIYSFNVASEPLPLNTVLIPTTDDFYKVVLSENLYNFYRGSETTTALRVFAVGPTSLLLNPKNATSHANFILSALLQVVTFDGNFIDPYLEIPYLISTLYEIIKIIPSPNDNTVELIGKLSSVLISQVAAGLIQESIEQKYYDQIIYIFEWILSMYETTGRQSLGSIAVSLQAAMRSIDISIQRSMLCTESPIFFSGTFLNHTIGVVLPSPKTSLYGFNFQLAPASKCYYFGYSDIQRTDNRISGRFIRVDKKFKKLDVYDELFNTPAVIYNFTLQHSSSFFNGLNREDPSFRRSCAYYNGFSFTIEGCNVLDEYDDTIQCSCSVLREFTFGLINVPVRPVPAVSTATRFAPTPSGIPAPLPMQNAPIATDASFDNSGSFIIINFDKPVSVLIPGQSIFQKNLSPFPCDYFLNTNNSSSGLLGTSITDCMARIDQDGETIVIRPSPSLGKVVGGIVPGNSIQFKNEAVFSRDTLNSRTTNGTVVVKAPLQANSPSVSILGPNRIDNCPNLIFVFQINSGTGGRRWKSVSASFQAEAHSSDAILLERLQIIALQVANATASKFVIEKELLTARSYVFSFAFTNFLNASITSTYSFEKIAISDIPLVQVQFPSGNIDFTKDVRIKAIVTPPVCLTTNGVLYSWSSDTFVLRGLLTGPSYIIPANTLAPSTTYTINLSAGFVGLNQYSFSKSFTTQDEVIIVDTGASTVVSSDTQFTITPSIRSNFIGRSVSSFTCAWSCFDVAINSACYDPDTFSTIPETDGSCGPVIIPGRKLFPGTYQFQVIATLGNRQISGRTAFIEVSGGFMIPVSITSNEVIVSSKSNTFFLQAEVEFNNTITYSWTSEAVCNGVVYSTIPLNSDTVVSAFNSKVLKIRTGVFIGGASYCMKVSVLNTAFQASGSSSYIVDISTGPIGGSCQLLSSGTVTSFSDQIDYSCSGWTTDAKSYPLRYLFEWYQVDTTEVHSFTVLSNSFTSTLNIRTPPGTFRIRARIIDALGAENDVEQLTTIVSALPFTGIRKRDVSGDISNELVTLAINFTNSALEEFSVTGDYTTALQSIALISPIIRSNTGLPNEVVVRNALLSFLTTVAEQENLLETSVTIPYISSIVVNLIGQEYSLDTASSNTLFALIRQMASIGSNSSTCYGDNTANDYASVIDAILGSLSKRSLNSSYFGQNFDQTVEDIDKCLIKSQVCDESPKSFSTTNYNHSVGIKSLSLLNADYCSFNVSDLASAYGNIGCVRYSCADYSVNSIKSIPLNSSFTERLNISRKIEFFGLNNTQLSSSLGSTKVSFTLTIPESVKNKYNLVNFNRAISKRSTLKSWSAICVFNNGIEYSSNDCEMVSFNGGIATCECGSIGEYSIAFFGIESPIVTTSQISTFYSTATSNAGVTSTVSGLITDGITTTIKSESEPTATTSNGIKHMGDLLMTLILLLVSMFFSN